MDITWIFGHILAIGIGISLGLLGGGGSILAVPILIYVMGLSAREAIAASLFIVGVVSLMGLIPHAKAGNVSLKLALTFAPAAMVGAYGGAKLAELPFISDTIQLVAFGLVMFLASILMIRKKRAAVPVQPASTSTPKSPSFGKTLLIPLEGILVGVITGFVGVGGGFAIIPALVLLGGTPMKEAIGTSLLIIALKSATAFWGYLGQVSLDWGIIISFTIAASLGTYGGAVLSHRIDASHLQKGFGYFVLAVSIFVLIQR
ncbi:sulfite exporter TauE/SafE family protein [Geitlerinema sp. P-1104]|uniref:sulfite exporter TauE/SafE family protein n=1 Tax=Geitlerinema sp. P-1104 TaxID=2546230 RepID=UPI001476FF36|nr:sulfite exporter TauE/SafE family protein [Geitlerinema sp. P-1104]NMG57385.1 sulfite exporter TauE/SafE family protein [Geitlerinema sp. P-1104]